MIINFKMSTECLPNLISSGKDCGEDAHWTKRETFEIVVPTTWQPGWSLEVKLSDGDVFDVKVSSESHPGARFKFVVLSHTEAYAIEMTKTKDKDDDDKDDDYY